MIDFKVIFNIKPVPKGRPRTTAKGWTYTPRASQEFEEEIRKQLNGVSPDIPFECRLAYEMRFYDDWIEVHIWETLKDKPNKLRGDLDNYEKAVLDALQGIVFKNDSQFDEGHVYRAATIPLEN